MEELQRQYDPEYYRLQSGGSRRSSEIIMNLLFKDFGQIGSVIDVGCGVGTWLAVCRQLGCTVTIGTDRQIIDGTQLQIDAKDFVPANLEERIRFNRRYDLCLSLEVAEHLSRRRAPSFVEDLCALSDMVLFGAAVPGQGGTNHVNEQWHGFWASLFDRNGYGCFDLIRCRVWHDSRVDWWYAQNTYLFVNRKAEKLQKLAESARGNLESSILYDTMHPILQSKLIEAASDYYGRWQYSEKRIRELEKKIGEMQATVLELLNSKSWRYTKVLRLISSLIQKIHGNFGKKMS